MKERGEVILKHIPTDPALPARFCACCLWQGRSLLVSYREEARPQCQGTGTQSRPAATRRTCGDGAAGVPFHRSGFLLPRNLLSCVQWYSSSPRATYQNPPSAPQLQTWAANFTLWLEPFGWDCRWGHGRGGVTLVLQPRVHLFIYYPFNTPKPVYSVCFPYGNFWEQTRANK